MVEQGHYRSYDPDNDGYDENVTDHRVLSYRFGRTVRANSHPENSVPLFLSDADGEPDPSEYMAPVRSSRRATISSRILAGVLVAAAAAIVVALFSSDAMRDVIVSAKASIVAVLPAPSAAAQPDPTRLTTSDITLKDPTRLQAPANQTTASEASQRSRWRRRGRKSRRPIRARYRDALRPLRHRPPQLRSPRHHHQRRRRRGGLMPTNLRHC